MMLDHERNLLPHMKGLNMGDLLIKFSHHLPAKHRECALIEHRLCHTGCESRWQLLVSPAGRPS